MDSACSESRIPVLFPKSVCQKIVCIWNAGELLNEKIFFPTLLWPPRWLVYFLKTLLVPLGRVSSSVLCSKEVALFMFIFESKIVRSNPSHLCASLYSGHERFSPTVCSSLFSAASNIWTEKYKRKKKKTLNSLQHLEDKMRCKQRDGCG